MDAILKRAYRTPGLMRGKNAPIGGAPPKPTASEPDKTQADTRTTAGQGGDR